MIFTSVSVYPMKRIFAPFDIRVQLMALKAIGLELNGTILQEANTLEYTMT